MSWLFAPRCCWFVSHFFLSCLSQAPATGSVAVYRRPLPQKKIGRRFFSEGGGTSVHRLLGALRLRRPYSHRSWTLRFLLAKKSAQQIKWLDYNQNLTKLNCNQERMKYRFRIKKGWKDLYLFLLQFIRELTWKMATVYFLYKIVSWDGS